MTKKIFIIIFAVIVTAPFITFGIIHLGHLIHQCTEWDILPNGISNQDLFLFAGAYSGGLCTLLAFWFTARHNENSLKITIEENRRQLQYQLEIQEIQKEHQIISQAISGFNPYEMEDTISKIKNFELSSIKEKSELLYIRERINRRMSEFHLLQCKLIIETKIHVAKDYKCPHLSPCLMCAARIDFTKTFLDLNGLYSELLGFMSVYVENLVINNLLYPELNEKGHAYSSFHSLINTWDFMSSLEKCDILTKNTNIYIKELKHNASEKLRNTSPRPNMCTNDENGHYSNFSYQKTDSD